MNSDAFDKQFHLSRADYLAGLDMVTWLRHYHVVQDLLASAPQSVLEIGSGDGVVRRCVLPMVPTYSVFDINARLEPDYVGDLKRGDAGLAGRFDAVVATEVMEHLPFVDLPACLANLCAWLRPGGHAFVSLPHRKSSVTVLTPRQRLHTWRFPNGLLSLSEAYNRFVRGRIWIDPNHCWEIGDGRVTRADVELRFAQAGFTTVKQVALPYCDYWVLAKPGSSAA
jgi:SAM-dependent methyltransferase